ncbi:MAG TPA: translocation/assembly module TamB domain-containing protein, partial [Draconibacterium sp.]|nr:translocation/assembly module TamB domain-containing protein [Draconibacterium sp.]
AGLVHIPAVQNKIVDAATSFVSKKTNTKIEIKNISIKFPKTVVIEGLFLEDTNKDTLIYAGSAKINIALYGLITGKIAISTVSLNDAVLNLHSTKTDPLFNYNFLIASFADSTQQTQTDTLKASKWTFSLDDVYLKNIRFTYNDVYSGINVFAVIQKSEFSVEEFSPKKPLYQFNELVLEGLNLIVQTSEPANAQKEKSGKILPTIIAQKLQLINSTVNYTDSVNYLSVNTKIDHIKLEKGLVDVQNEKITFDYINLSESDIRYHTFVPEIVAGSNSPGKSNWKVTVNRLDAENNMLDYKVGDGPELTNEFDGKHLELAQLTFEATNFYYDSELTKISVKNLSAINQNHFVVNSLETDFSMDQYSITADKLKLKTPHSSIDADFHVEFTSLANFTDSLQFSNLNLVMRKVSLKNPDVLYFNAELNKQPFFKNPANITTMSGAVNGPLNNLTGKNLFIKTGTNTVVETDFNIRGLPDAKTATYNFPNLIIISGKKDMELMAGDSIPKNINLPENINLQIAFKGEAKSFETTVIAGSSFGDAQLSATIDKSENFTGKVNTTNFDLGKLLKDTVMYGPVSLTAETSGHGLDKNTVAAKIKAEISQIYLYQYTYHNFNVDGNISGQEFEGKMNLNDENAVFDFEGLVSINPDKERIKFRLNVLGADLQKLHFTQNDIRIALVAAADLKGGTVKKLNGSAAITNMIIAQGEETYTLDSLLFASVNETRKSEINFSSALVGVKYSGTISPADISAQLNNFVQIYFPFKNGQQLEKNNESSDFKFEIQLHNHPLLSQVLLPQLKEFEPGIIQGYFDSEKNDLKINAKMKKIVYGTTEIKDFEFDVNSNPGELNYKISSSAVSNAQIKLENFLIDGKLADNKINTTISSVDEKKNKKLLISTEITKDGENFRMALDPAGFYLADKQWDIAADNYVEFGNQGFLIHHLFMNKTGSEVNIASVNDRFNDDLNVEIRNFKLEDISGIIEKDTSFVKGTVDGNALLKRVNDSYGLIADAKIANLFVSGIPIGNLTVKAENPTREKFNIDLNLSGTENNLTTKGYYIAKGGDNSISLTTDIQSLSLKTIQAFSMGTITEASGNLSGNFLVKGNSTSPVITGELIFKNAFITPAALNNRLEIKDEYFQLKKDGIYFDDFTIYDVSQNTAVINGAVNMNHFTDFAFDLSVSANDFLLFNTTAKDNKVFFGRMIIDSEIDVTGPIALPVVNATIKMKKGSNFTFAVPEDRLTTNKGEGVIEFDNKQKLHPILMRENNKQIQKTNLTGFDVYSVIEIDKEATLRLLLDPSSTDSLVVRGEAALSFTMDRSGQMSLTGAYNLNDGSYLVSLESLIKRTFEIDKGSTIIWNGDPMEAEVDIDAIYSVRASPIDLMADQMAGLTKTDRNAYKERHLFLVILKLKGDILHPEIGFEIQLRPEDKGILNGAVNQKLTLLNEDASALNKQVFALLVLGRFIQENPLQSDAGGGTSTFVPATVGKLLSQQLNQWSSKVLPGVDLNFDIQSYNQFETGEAQGRTQVDIGLKKQLFNERLSVQLGGTLEVEGVKAKQNSASDIASDVVLEYKLTKDGRYRLKGFRQNQYESDIDGQFVETGVGISYVRDFDKWTNFFRRTKVEKGKLKKLKKNDKLN